MPAPPLEPFRIKMVEAIPFLTRAEREARLHDAGWNVFNLQAQDVTIDLLTDSGTAALSQEQYAGLILGDAAYAGGRSYQHLESVIQDLFGFPEIIPTHQGRAAENLLCSLLLEPGQVVPSNDFFDTTRANVEAQGALPLNLAAEGMWDPTTPQPFKGDLDLEQLEGLLLESAPGAIPFGMVTITNNSRAGQPVSMANLRGISQRLHESGIPFFIDACRFAENAWFIRQREPGYADRSIRSIVREMFDLADGCTMSAKKDGLANSGGFLCLRDPALAERARNLLIRLEGFPTYGGMSGREMETIAIGLQEAVTDSYLEYRTGQVAYLGALLTGAGVPIFEPPGGHAVYIDAGRVLPQVPGSRFPAQQLVCEAYLEGGVRTVEVGSSMFGYPDPRTGEVHPPPLELVRLALPRRVYTSTHLQYVAETFAAVVERKETFYGLEMTWSPAVLRHFRARFAPVTERSAVALT